MSLNLTHLIGFGGGGGNQVPSYVSASTGTTTTAADTLAINYPSGIQANDIIIAVALGEDSSGALFGDTAYLGISNFTTIALAGVASSTGKYAAGVSWKRASGSESGTETATFQTLGGSRAISGIMYLFRNCITTGNPYENEAADDNATSTTLNQKSIASTDGGRMALHITMCQVTTTTASFTGESGGDFTEQSSYQPATNTIQLQTASLPTTSTISGGSSTLGTTSRHTRSVFCLIGAP